MAVVPCTRECPLKRLGITSRFGSSRTTAAVHHQRNQEVVTSIKRQVPRTKYVVSNVIRIKGLSARDVRNVPNLEGTPRSRAEMGHRATSRAPFYMVLRPRCTTIAEALVILALAATVGQAWAQDAVPAEMLYRTVPIIAGDEEGSGFFIDAHEKLYPVTARHVVNALPTCNAQVQVWFDNQWKSLAYNRVLIPDSDADVAVLEAEWKPPKPFLIPPTQDGGTDGPTFGQQVWFLGYPL